MAKTRSEINNDYMRRNYKRLQLLLPFDMVEKIKSEYPEKPLSTYIKELITQDLEQKTE